MLRLGNASVLSMATMCRWINKGYQDGEPGTFADIQERLDTYEHCVVLYTRSERALKERIAALEEELRDARSKR